MRYFNSCLLTLLLTLLPGCSIVDVQPFTTATKEMAAAISTSMQQIQASFKQADKVFQPTANQKCAWEAYKVTLKQNTDGFKKVATSFTAYASALESVTADGKAHEEKIKQVFEATKQLADAATAYVGPYAIPLATAIKGLNTAVTALNVVSTNNNLKSLASRQQDSVIQKTARLLRASLKMYAKADSDAYVLLLNNDPVHDAATLYGNAAQERRAYAQPRLSLLVLAQSSLLSQPLAPDLLDSTDGYIRKLENLQVDTDGQIRKDFNAFKKNHKAVKSNALFTTLRNREHYYLKLVADNSFPQAVAEAEAKRWDAIYTIPQQKSREQFEKSQQALSIWANSHHELRQLLLKAGQVTRQDLVGQAQNVQQVLAELKDAQEAAAKATKAAKEAAAKPKA